jgi:hypothetical protein
MCKEERQKNIEMSENNFGKISWRFIAVLFFAAFFLNWFWEMGQMYWYRGMSGMDFLKVTVYCTLATFGDALLTLGGYALGRLFTHRFLFLWMIIFGAICALLIEFAALNFDIWSYKRSMPMVPLINVGILPFVQLTVLMPVALWIASKVSMKSGF